ncbi:MFS transporter [Bacillus sp. B15-48]|uniref:MFS transporter n=1 Tax=Bacillus sp. B15-48 TaxID=1548601 RepID=UPI00193FD7A1|nr:MFS transporter [Bacillus sp. B15-48]
MNNKKLYLTAAVLYFSYMLHGIGVSILAQYKSDFAEMWGAPTLADGTLDVSMVLTVIAALGLGRLISLPFAGPFSDKFGRKPSGIVGMVAYIIYFVGIIFAPNMYVAYAFALFGGIANSFIDTCVYPSIVEIFKKKGDIGNLFVKFSISIGQFLLPFMIGFVAANALTFKTLFYLCAVLIAVCALLIAFLPFPTVTNNDKTEKGEVKKVKMKFTATTWAIIAMGFTTSATFMLWLNANQELGKLYGLADPSKIQSFYAIGTVVAVLVTAALISKKILQSVQILFLYPAISAIMLLVLYFVESPTLVLVGGFVLGYAAAGGVLQLVTTIAVEVNPANAGKMTSMVMIASSLANYLVLTAAGAITKMGGIAGPKYLLLFNFAITIIGVILAIYVNKKYAEKEKYSSVKMAG